MDQAVQSGRFHVYVFEGGSRCFAPETLVVTENGPKPICAIQPGEAVKCLDENMRVVYRPVKNVFRFPVDKPMVEIRLTNGEYIRCSADHKFLYNGKYTPIIDILREKNHV